MMGGVERKLDLLDERVGPCLRFRFNRAGTVEQTRLEASGRDAELGLSEGGKQQQPGESRGQRRAAISQPSRNPPATHHSPLPLLEVFLAWCFLAFGPHLGCCFFAFFLQALCAPFLERPAGLPL